AARLRQGTRQRAKRAIGAANFMVGSMTAYAGAEFRVGRPMAWDFCLRGAILCNRRKLHHKGRPAMIKVSVMYPNTPGHRFDHVYYRDKHMPMVKAKMGNACKRYTVDKGLAGGAPGTPATYVGMCHIFCDSVESFQAGFGPHAKEIMADIPNYTDLSPV